MMTLVFYGSLFLVFFAYFGYALTLWAVALFCRKEVKKASFFPPVTLIITAFNEEKRIREKLENVLALEYPREKLQVLVASDGSTDATNQIVKEYSNRGIELFHVKERRGKENAQKEAVAAARGDIFAFSDVATMIVPKGLEEMVANFADPGVGCVSSVDRIIGRDGKPCGEGFYVRYEMWLRQIESQANSLVGLSGSFFAARKEVCRDFSAEMQSDFRTLLNSIKVGLRGVSDPEAVGYYQDISKGRKEFDRKVRTVLRGLTVFFHNLEFLNFFRYGLFSYQYFCHKLLRWLVPVFLISAFWANISLALESKFFLGVFVLQMAFYGTALWVWFQKEPLQNPLLKIPLYFLTVNAAILVAWLQYLKGNRVVMWAPSER